MNIYEFEYSNVALCNVFLVCRTKAWRRVQGMNKGESHRAFGEIIADLQSLTAK